MTMSKMVNRNGAAKANMQNKNHETGSVNDVIQQPFLRFELCTMCWRAFVSFFQSRS
jgi:hypothetical protein